MTKTILLTGATDGIGLETAKSLSALGHRVLLHGRNAEKLTDVAQAIADAIPGAQVERYLADLSNLENVENLVKSVSERHPQLDVLINNAGVFRSSTTVRAHGLDLRMVVNVLAPYLLTQRLLPLMNPQGRIVNLSSAAQATVNLAALTTHVALSDGGAYAQSKLALTMWSRQLGLALGEAGPVVVSVNPGSMLGTKMVRESFGVRGKSVQIGSDILVRAALSDEFADATGTYYDNDAQRFEPPHADALDDQKVAAVVEAIEAGLRAAGHPL